MGCGLRVSAFGGADLFAKRGVDAGEGAVAGPDGEVVRHQAAGRTPLQQPRNALLPAPATGSGNRPAPADNAPSQPNPLSSPTALKQTCSTHVLGICLSAVGSGIGRPPPSPLAGSTTRGRTRSSGPGSLMTRRVGSTSPRCAGRTVSSCPPAGAAAAGGSRARAADVRAVRGEDLGYGRDDLPPLPHARSRRGSPRSGSYLPEERCVRARAAARPWASAPTRRRGRGCTSCAGRWSVPSVSLLTGRGRARREVPRRPKRWQTRRIQRQDPDHDRGRTTHETALGRVRLAVADRPGRSTWSSSPSTS